MAVEHIELVLFEGGVTYGRTNGHLLEVATCPQKRCVLYGTGRNAGGALVDEEVGFYLVSWKGEWCVRIVKNRRVELVEGNSNGQRGALRRWGYCVSRFLTG